MDLTEVARAMRRYWLLALAVFAVVLAAGYVSTRRSTPLFEAVTMLSVSPNPAVGGSYDSVRYQLPVLVERIGSPAFRRSLEDSVSAEALGEVNELFAENEVAVIVEVTARGTDRDAVAQVANAAAAATIDHYATFDSVDATTASTGGPVVIEVISEAVPDPDANRASAAPVMLASGVLGTMLATAATVMAHRWSSLRDVTNRIRRDLAVPVLAVIPEAAGLEAGKADLAQTLAGGPAPLTDALHDLRSRVAAFLGDEGAGVVAVTSWGSGEARATLTAALALTFASVRREVVAVDADLAGPELEARIGASPAPGSGELSTPPQATSDDRRPDGAIRVVALPRVDRHPAEVLAEALPPLLREVTSVSPQAVVVVAAPPLDGGRPGPWLGVPAETATVLGAARLVVLMIDPAADALDKLALAADHLREHGVALGAVLYRRMR